MPPTGGITKSITRSRMKSGYLGVSSSALKPAMTQRKERSPLDVFAPMVLPQAEAKDNVKLGLRLG